MKTEYTVPPRGGIAFDVRKGQTVTVIDVEGGQVADFFAVTADGKEFLSAGVTMDCNESLSLAVGDYIYSNLYNPMFRVLYDDVGRHDLIHPCCRKEMYDFFYGNGAGHPNCLDNINSALGTDMPAVQPLNIFMNTKAFANGKIKVMPPLSKAGDKIMFIAETDVRIAVAACSVSESDCNGGKCASIKIIVRD